MKTRLIQVLGLILVVLGVYTLIILLSLYNYGLFDSIEELSLRRPIFTFWIGIIFSIAGIALCILADNLSKKIAVKVLGSLFILYGLFFICQWQLAITYFESSNYIYKVSTIYYLVTAALLIFSGLLLSTSRVKKDEGSGIKTIQ